MPPVSLISSNARRTALELLTPCTAVTPDRSVMVPTRISVSVTPRWVSADAADASTASAAVARDQRTVAATAILVSSIDSCGARLAPCEPLRQDRRRHLGA